MWRTVATINLSNANAAELTADALVVGVAQDGDAPVLLADAADLENAFEGRLAAALSALGAKGKAGEVTKLAAVDGVAAKVVLAVGLGPVADAVQPESLRRAAGTAARALAGSKKAVVALPAADSESVGAVVEGLALGAYAYDRYKKGDAPLGSATVVTPLARDKAAKAALKRAAVLGEAVSLTRDWVNTPPSDLPPATFATAATTAVKDAPVEVEVLDDKALRKGGYGGIIGVGQGSVNPPRLVRLTYRPKRAKAHIALVGKGITFDSGGLSIKPADGMVTMKCDMSGAAAVITATLAIARLGIPVSVTTYAAMAENMPSGTAQRPSDVLTMYGGKTVEVLNTDAEGRLVMADALARASEDKPDIIVDVATLTGACVVALGTRVAGIMSNDDELRDTIHAISADAGEQMWPLPLPEELREKLDSPVADIANLGERWGGALSAGLFLKEFVGEGIRWAHLDIAGPAFNEGQPHGYTPKGGTGSAVRTLVKLAEEAADGAL